MSTHNLCFEQKCENYQTFLPENLSLPENVLFFVDKIFNIFE